MVIALTVLHVLMCFAIIAMVLFLQAGKAADIEAAFGGARSQPVFGSMGTPTVVGKITAVVAILFTITSFSLALLGGERSSSVVREPAPASAPATSAPPTPSTPTPSTPAPATPGAPAPGK